VDELAVHFIIKNSWGKFIGGITFYVNKQRVEDGAPPRYSRGRWARSTSDWNSQKEGALRLWNYAIGSIIQVSIFLNLLPDSFMIVLEEI
jgi:hypothetical protein